MARARACSGKVYTLCRNMLQRRVRWSYVLSPNLYVPLRAQLSPARTTDDRTDRARLQERHAALAGLGQKVVLGEIKRHLVAMPHAGRHELAHHIAIDHVAAGILAALDFHRDLGRDRHD